MTLSKLLTKRLPDLAEVGHRSVVDQLLDAPPLAPARFFWNTFYDLRPFWPAVIPILLLVGLRTYRREREAYLLEHTLRRAQNVETD